MFNFYVFYYSKLATMKKLLCICMLFIGCTSKETKLIDKSENFLLTSLKDPSSYRKIEAKIIDTTMESDYLKSEIFADSIKYLTSLEDYKSDSLKNTSELNSKKIIADNNDPYKKLIFDSKTSFENDKSQLQKLTTDSIITINIAIKYRAKNNLGVMDIFVNTIHYNPSEDKFELYN